MMFISPQALSVFSVTQYELKNMTKALPWDISNISQSCNVALTIHPVSCNRQSILNLLNLKTLSCFCCCFCVTHIRPLCKNKRELLNFASVLFHLFEEEFSPVFITQRPKVWLHTGTFNADKFCSCEKNRSMSIEPERTLTISKLLTSD